MNRDEREFKKIIDTNFPSSPPGWRKEPDREYGPLSSLDRVDDIDDFVPPPVPRVRLRATWFTISLLFVIVGVVIGAIAWVLDPAGVTRLIGLAFAVIGFVVLLILALRRKGSPDEGEPRL